MVGVLQAKIETVIDKLNLPADTLIAHLSGGLKKRVWHWHEHW
jgi:ATP-binding cassette subfamily F protein uup